MNQSERNQDATLYIGNLEEKVTEHLLWELMLQAGPVVAVSLPKDRVSNTHQGFGFVEFQSAMDADYAMKIMNQVRLFGKPIKLSQAASDKRQVDVGANLFVGHLDSSTDEHTLADTFSKFGSFAAQPTVARDAAGTSKGYGFVFFDSFDASDAALQALQGQYLHGSAMSIDYALKRGGKGERHGSEAERLLAAEAHRNGILKPQTVDQPALPMLPGAASSLVPPPPPPPGFFPVGQPQFQPPPGFAPM